MIPQGQMMEATSIDRIDEDESDSGDEDESHSRDTSIDPWGSRKI